MKRMNGKRWNSKYLPIIFFLCALFLGGCGRKNTVAEPELTESTAVQIVKETMKETQESSQAAETDTPAEEMPEEEPEKTFIIASDIHYLSDLLTDGGDAFTYMVQHGDGKVVQYIDQIVDAFIEEVIKKQPDALILSGDLSFNGERLSNTEFAEKIRKVRDSGIPVLVIPGNHDINNPAAAQFKEHNRLPAETTSSQDFLQIYQDFGYNEAISRDLASLSYVYQLDENLRFLMLDSCQYDPVNRVGGMIKTETYEWLEAQMEDAWEVGATVIPVSHHNLLDESEVYVEDCTIEHSEELISFLEGWDIPIYLSGHLHVQHMKQAYEDEGIYEIVTSSLATPPCQYGILEMMDNGTYRYHTKTVDIEKWARTHQVTEEELLHFDDFKTPFLSRVFYNQAKDKMKDKEIPEKAKVEMSKLYAKLNTYYYAGEAYRVKRIISSSPLYKSWENYMFSDILLQYMQSIISDGIKDYNTAVIE